MYSPFSFSPWNDQLLADVHPKFVYGRSGWLLAISLLMIALGVNHGWQTFEAFKPIGNGVRPEVRLMILSILAVEILITLNLFLPGFLLLTKWRYSLLAAKAFLALSPFFLFVGRTFIEPCDRDVLSAAISYLVPNLFFFSTPILLYLIYSRRVQNTFMFAGSRMPSKISCPFCLLRQTLTPDERKSKQLHCLACGRQIASATVAA